MPHTYSVIWHSMSYPETSYISARDAANVFSISKRTIERKIASGELSGTQIRMDGAKRMIHFGELIRVF